MKFEEHHSSQWQVICWESLPYEHSNWQTELQYRNSWDWLGNQNFGAMFNVFSVRISELFWEPKTTPYRKPPDTAIEASLEMVRVHPTAFIKVLLAWRITGTKKGTKGMVRRRHMTCVHNVLSVQSQHYQSPSHIPNKFSTTSSGDTTSSWQNSGRRPFYSCCLIALNSLQWQFPWKRPLSVNFLSSYHQTDGDDTWSIEAFGGSNGYYGAIRTRAKGFYVKYGLTDRIIDARLSLSMVQWLKRGLDGPDRLGDRSSGYLLQQTFRALAVDLRNARSKAGNFTSQSISSNASTGPP